MGADVGKAVGGHREQSLPRTLGSHRRQGRQPGFEVRPQIARCCLELLTTPLAGLYQAVLAAQEESMLRCPASIVVRPLGVPDHDVGQTDVVALGAVDRLGRQERTSDTSETVPPTDETEASRSRSR